MSGGRGAILKVLVVLWVAALALGFVSQTTELFGTRGGVLAWLLLAVAALGFVVIGALGVWLVLRWLASDQQGEGARRG